jgi:hypothetical protein
MILDGAQKHSDAAIAQARGEGDPTPRL